MMLQVALIQQRTGVQVLRACDSARAEARTGKTLLIERAGVGCMLEDGAQLVKLECPALLRAPLGSGRRQGLELAVTRAESPTLGQESVSPADGVADAARHPFIERQERV